MLTKGVPPKIPVIYPDVPHAHVAAGFDEAGPDEIIVVASDASGPDEIIVVACDPPEPDVIIVVACDAPGPDEITAVDGSTTDVIDGCVASVVPDMVPGQEEFIVVVFAEEQMGTIWFLTAPWATTFPSTLMRWQKISVKASPQTNKIRASPGVDELLRST
jgi:hypothetical protein